MFLCTGHTRDAVLTTEPSSSIFFIGEFVTFKCDMNEGADTDWEYKISRNGQKFIPYDTRKEYRLQITSTLQSAEFQCSGRRKNSCSIENSNTVSLTVLADKPRATLTAGTTIIPVGGSVTLTCSVWRSAGWKYEWFRRDNNTTETHIRQDDQQNRVIRVSQGGIYSCRGGRGRGNSVFYTHKSDDVTIEITFSNKVVVKGQPNHPQIFSGETISLTCDVQEGGETTEWEYGWRGPNQTAQWTHNLSWIFKVSASSSGDYMCKSRRRDDSYSSTEWSEAFNLSVSTDKPKATLTAGTTIIPVGGNVTLTCSVRSSAGWKYEWFTRDKNTTETHIRQDDQPDSDIRVSQGGIYSCRGGRGNPVFYTHKSDDITIEITSVLRSEGSSFPVLLITALSCGVLLILLLLLLCHFKQSKDSRFGRTQSTNQRPTTNHMINQDEAQYIQYASPPQDDSLLYAEVSYNRAKVNRKKGKSAPPAADETIYSEVKSQPAFDDSLLYAQVSHNRTKAKRDKDDSLLYAQVSQNRAKAKRDKD